MGTPLRVLMIEDSEDDAVLLQRELRRGGYDVAFGTRGPSRHVNSALDTQSGTWLSPTFPCHIFPARNALRLCVQRDRRTLHFCFGHDGEENRRGGLAERAQDYS